MAITECLRRLGRIGLHKDRIAVRQRDDKKAHLPGHATDYRPGLAKIRLGMTRWMRQRNKRLLQAQAPRMYIIPHHRIAAIKATFLTQPIIDPLDRMALLLRHPYIIMQYLVDKAGMRVALRTPQRHMPAITQWHRMRHHLRNRPSVYPKATRSFPLANTLAQYRKPNTTI